MAYNSSNSVFESKTQTPSAFDKSVLGDKFQTDQGTYDNFTNQAYNQATRTLDPYFDKQRNRMEQDAINKGFAPGAAGYQDSLQDFERQENDAYNSAAFNAMQYGANRLDADRGFDEGQRQFDASMMEGGRQFDRGDATTRYGISSQAQAAKDAATAKQRALDEQSRQFDANYGEGNRRFDQTFGLQEMGALEGIAGDYRDDAYRDAVFNSQQDQQQYNNLLASMGLMPGSNFNAPNTSSAFDNSLTGDIYNQRSNDAMYGAIGQGINDLATNVDWSQIFNSSPTTQSYGDWGTGVQA